MVEALQRGLKAMNNNNNKLFKLLFYWYLFVKKPHCKTLLLLLISCIYHYDLVRSLSTSSILLERRQIEDSSSDQPKES